MVPVWERADPTGLDRRCDLRPSPQLKGESSRRSRSTSTMLQVDDKKVNPRALGSFALAALPVDYSTRLTSRTNPCLFTRLSVPLLFHLSRAGRQDRERERTSVSSPRDLPGFRERSTKSHVLPRPSPGFVLARRKRIRV